MHANATSHTSPGPWLLVLMGLLAGNAAAQEDLVEHCRKTSSDADRIACLEAALLGRETPPAPEPTAAPKPAPTSDEPQGIGAEQVLARRETHEESAKRLDRVEGLAVASYSTVPYKKLQVTLKNGQVWRQIKGDKQRIKVDLRRNQTVDIEESGLSGYKLHLNEMRRTVRVERVR